MASKSGAMVQGSVHRTAVESQAKMPILSRCCFETISDSNPVLLLTEKQKVVMTVVVVVVVDVDQVQVVLVTVVLVIVVEVTVEVEVDVGTRAPNFAQLHCSPSWLLLQPSRHRA